MASPGEMVKRIAETLGVPEASVTLHDRNLADAGLRTKGGRGRSAAKMSACDAANLLMAVAGSSMVKDAVQTVEAYANLPARNGEFSFDSEEHRLGFEGSEPRCWHLAGFPIAALQELTADHTFKDALSALISAAASGSLQETIDKLPTEMVGEHRIPNLWRIEVILWGPYPQSAIRIFARGFSEKHSYSLIPDDMDALMKWSRDLESSSQSSGDLKQTREFSAKTILAVGDLLKN